MKFITADLHLGDERLVEATRPQFSSSQEHDDHIIYHINASVKRNDELIIVGDIGNIKVWKTARSWIKCKRIIVIKGNHDRTNKLVEVFGKANVYESRCLKLSNGKLGYFHHFPHAFWEKSHYGSYHFYGHCHAQREQELNRCWPDRYSWDVGVDNAFKYFQVYCPFPEDWLISVLSLRKGHEQPSCVRPDPIAEALIAAQKILGDTVDRDHPYYRQYIDGCAYLSKLNLESSCKATATSDKTAP